MMLTGTLVNAAGILLGGGAGPVSYTHLAVWIGYSESNEKITASGNPAAKIWKLVMEQVHEGRCV